MLLLVLFAFIAGIVTILSPCILPILPVVLSGSVGGGKRRPLGTVIGFVASFTFFTLALTSIVKLTGLPSDALRVFSIVMIFVFGLALLWPKFQLWMEIFFSRFSSLVPQSKNTDGFRSGLLLGLSLGLIWTPCVGPIIASVITLAATSSVTFGAALITLAYSLGTALPMFVVMYGGRELLNKVPWLLKNTGKIQQGFGVLMIVTAAALFFNLDRQFQSFVLTRFPQYGTGLTQVEDNQIVKQQLSQLSLPKSLPMENGQQTAPELIVGGQWFNSPPLKLSDLRGKVVLVDFWTYTCINCIRTLPFLKAWHEKYADKGLVIIGVHTPEFEFEKSPNNVQKALKDFGITYPVMQDNNYATWTAYNNRYWPAKYFIDKNGSIRSVHFGEGEENESERTIQMLLQESGADVKDMPINNQSYQIQTRTPETYLGYARLDGFASLEDIQKDQSATYRLPTRVPRNSVAYEGNWTVSAERAAPAKEATLTFNFEASQVYLVMIPKNGQTAKVRVFLDGEVIGASEAGADVHDGLVTVTDDRLYHLVKLNQPGQHILKLQFLDSNVELYAFTFG